MKRDLNFWLGLEIYIRAVAKRNPVPYPWIGVGAIFLAILTSTVSSRASFVSVGSVAEAASRAASLGDYAAAQELFGKLNSETANDSVLGAQSELEDKIYPERVLEKKIAELEDKITKYPGNREMFIELSNLYKQLGNQEMANEYREKARVLDPNGVEF